MDKQYPTGGVITVMVFLAESGKTYVISINPNANVLELKSKIREQTGVDADTLTLTFGTKPLDDKRTLSNYGIVNASRIHGVRRFRGGFHIK